MTHGISIIIPSYNDENKLRGLVEHIRANSKKKNISEIIIVINGDLTASGSLPTVNGARVLHCPLRQRAAAMNVGAKIAQGSILYFVHADSLLPSGFDELILKSYRGGAGAGYFLLKFDSPNKMLKLFCFFVRLPWYWVHFGDQSLFIDAAVFRQVGGFNEHYSTMEDVDIVKRAKKLTRFRIIQNYLTTSARKYELHGYYRLQTVYIIVTLLYLAKAPQSLLVKLLSTLKESNHTKFRFVPIQPTYTEPSYISENPHS